MLRVMLVDDEPFILQGLSVLIDWNGLGFEIVKTAANGLEALEFLKKDEVDLIIADIRMPGMSGLELLENVRKSRITDAYFAIVSGYNDFAYARQAICNACVDYLLKPVAKDELIRLLTRVRSLHQESQRRRQEESRQEKAYFSRQLISIICGKYDRENLEYVNERLKLSGGIRYIAVEIDARDEAARKMTEEEKRGQQRALYTACLTILGKDGYHCIFDVSRKENSYDVGLIYCDRLAQEAEMEEQEYLDHFLDQIRRMMNVPVVMLVGNRVETLEEIGESSRSAAIARSFQDFRLEESGAQLEGEIAGGSGRLCKQTLDGLVSAVEQNDRAEISRCVAALYEEMNKGGLDAHLIGVNINYLLFQHVYLAAAQDENVNQEEVLHFISANAFEEGTIRGSRVHLVQFAREYADYLTQLRSRSARGVLAEIEKEIQENYSRNLTLRELSRKYFINSAYLGQLFRKKYGVAFKDYLNAYRMDRAAGLLLHTDMKTVEIAERVGYHDTDYFINRFIAVKGCTPAKFRKQMREGKREL